MGRLPAPEDLIVPSREERHHNADHMLKRFHEDLDRLALRHRGPHDARRTFISIARGDGARADLLRWVTHGASADILDTHTTLTWAVRCEAVTCMRLDLREGKVIVMPKAEAG